MLGPMSFADGSLARRDGGDKDLGAGWVGAARRLQRHGAGAAGAHGQGEGVIARIRSRHSARPGVPAGASIGARASVSEPARARVAALVLPGVLDCEALARWHRTGQRHREQAACQSPSRGAIGQMSAKARLR